MWNEHLHGYHLLTSIINILQMVNLVVIGYLPMYYTRLYIEHCEITNCHICRCTAL